MSPKTGVGVGGGDDMGAHWMPVSSRPWAVLVTEVTRLGEGQGLTLAL